MISSFHAIIPSFHGMISSFHAVFGLRQRDKSAKIIDYNDQVIRVREYLLFRGIPSPMYFQQSRKRQCTSSSTLIHATFPASTCNRPRKYLHPSSHVLVTVLASTCGKRCLLWNPFPFPRVFPDFITFVSH